MKDGEIKSETVITELLRVRTFERNLTVALRSVRSETGRWSMKIFRHPTRCFFPPGPA
jgi:hypothetical protein